jgi:hypothetical protein
LRASAAALDAQPAAALVAGDVRFAPVDGG